MSTGRNMVRADVATQNAPAQDASPDNPSEIYWHDVFSLRTMRERLPKAVHERLEDACKQGGGLAAGDADIVASAMKDWALSGWDAKNEASGGVPGSFFTELWPRSLFGLFCPAGF